MLAILVSWILIFFVFVSFGNIFTGIYNYVCGRSQTFSVIDTYLFGLCFATAIASVTSLWLPSNHYLLLAFVVTALLYWTIRRKNSIFFLKRIKDEWNNLSTAEKTFIILAILSVLFFSMRAYERYGDTIYDSLFYHQANIRWNEDFAVIPGLANLEERFGFNSNYLLISAPFTLRFLFGDAIYGICSLTTALMLAWTLLLVFRSGYGLKEICAFILFFFIVLFVRNDMNITSTDILPSLLIIFLATKAMLYTDRIKENVLLFALLPVYIMTLKMSCALILFSTLIMLFILIKGKQYKVFGFLCVASALIAVPWLIRNVIISGYLVYPLAAIDIFSFDWKVPIEIMQKELNYIVFHSTIEYKNDLIESFTKKQTDTKYYWHVIAFFTSAVFTFFCLLGMVVKRKKIQQAHWFAFFIIAVNVIYLLIQAPAFRFGMGFIYAIILLTCCIWIGGKSIRLSGYSLRFSFGQKNCRIKNLAILIVLTFMTYLSVNSVRNINRTKRHLIQETASNNDTRMENRDAMLRVLYKPFVTSDRIRMIDNDARYHSWPKAGFIPYKLSDSVSVYVSVDRQSYLYDMPLIVPNYDVPGTHFKSIFQTHHDLELRGSTIQEGFRTRFDNRSNLEKKIPVFIPTP